jgi:glycosyltransferase involved in cell wall biosynthesis
VSEFLPPFLVGTTAYNPHVQQMVRALYETDALYAYVSGGVDHFPRGLARASRETIRTWLPVLNRQLERRSVRELPGRLIESRWRWEIPRLLANRLGALEWEDWCWEHGELELDRYCARRLRQAKAGGFLGVEHGALTSIGAARALGKSAVVAFLSPHRQTRVAWVDVEYEKTPSLRSKGRDAIEALSGLRDSRRDQEARAADWVVTNSSFTTRSLVDAGFDAAKMLTVPLGGPDPIPETHLPLRVPDILRYVYVGPVSVRKGAHYLLRAWRRVAGAGAELHFYGQQMLSQAVIDDALGAKGGASISFHGSIPAAELPSVYQQASVLVFPTLCDGFGMVASEALANGLPVITTRNAGAADAIESGRSGLLIPPADEDALAGALQWCADNQRELFSMRRQALSAARRWTWSHFREAFRRELAGALSGQADGVKSKRSEHVAS